jgi:CRISPR-associated protein Cas1
MPVRRLHNYLYCPRLFYFQWVENLFEENGDTAAGSSLHRLVDQASRLDPEKESALLEGLPEGTRIRSLRLESNSLGLVGVVDLVEGGSGGAELVDYKKGSALRDDDGMLRAKENDAAQLAAYALLLVDVGVRVNAAAIYYAADRRRVAISLDEPLLESVRIAIREARLVAESGKLPDPLVNDARCLHCSAYGYCLPRESYWWRMAREESEAREEPTLPGFDADHLPERPSLVPDTVDHPPRPPRLDGELLVVQTAGAVVGQSGGEFTVSLKREVVRKLPIQQVRAIYVYGAVQMTAQATQTALEEEVDVAYFSPAGRFLGLLRGLPASGVDARMGQYSLFQQDFARRRLAAEVIRAKIHNQRVLLMRNGSAPDAVLNEMARLRDAARSAAGLGELLGIEGAAAHLYFREFPTMLSDRASWSFDFQGRNRRPPRDPVNSLLSLGYSVLTKELAGVCHAVGLDPYLGFLHQPRYGRPALALDLMEEFRPLIADSVALGLINRGELDEGDFIRSASGTILNERGRRQFWEAWFRRLDTDVSHPEFGYRMSYRRMLEVQARQLWRYVRGDSPSYHGFTTR